MMYLLRNGVPWPEIMAMSDVRRLACCVCIGEIDGGVFDWSALRWALQPL